VYKVLFTVVDCVEYRSTVSRYDNLTTVSETKWLLIKAELNTNESRLQSAVAIFAVFSHPRESISHI